MQNLVLIGLVYFLTLFGNSILANEIKIIFKGNIQNVTRLELKKGERTVVDSLYLTQNADTIILNSDYVGIHSISFDGKHTVFGFLQQNEKLVLVADMKNLKFDFRNSVESELLNNIFNSWVKEMSILNSLNPVTFSDFDVTFGRLESEISQTNYPEIIDWATIFLVNLETNPNTYLLPFERFSDFEQEVREKYPFYNFVEMKSNFTVRRDNQSGYYWKY